MKKAWVSPPRYIFRRFNVVRELKHYPDIESFVDVGCGAGEMACDIVSSFGFNGTGIDFSKSAIDISEKLKHERDLGNNLNFKLADASTIKKLKKVDLVTCFEVLEHVEDDKSLLNDLVELSKKYVVVSVPAKKRLFSDSDVLAGHYRRYEKEELTLLLQSSGLFVEKFIAYGYPFTNLFRILREYLSKKKLNTEQRISMDERSKKSGINVLGNKKHPSIPGYDAIIKPLLWFSLLFNKLDLSEGYLVICKKS